MTQLFYAYATPDARPRDQLERELRALKQRGLLDGWHARAVGPGAERADTRSPHLEQADVVLFLVSRDFISNEYCHGPDVQLALERHRRRQARVIPVVLRPCNWKEVPFAGLPALPEGGKPITEWRDSAAAFESVVAGLAAALRRTPTPVATPEQRGPSSVVSAAAPPAEEGVPAGEGDPAPAQVALNAQELGPEYEPLTTPGDGVDARAVGTRYVSLARSGKDRAHTRRVAQLVDRLDSARGAVARLEAAVRGEVAKGGQVDPTPGAPGEDIRRVYGARSPAPTVSVFATKGRFLVAAKVIDAAGTSASAGDAAELADAVVRRMLARIPS